MGKREQGRRAGCVKHTMCRGMGAGWFVCLGCGLAAVCPGCVEVSGMVGEVWFHLCGEHQWLATTGDGMGARIVWASQNSAR